MKRESIFAFACVILLSTVAQAGEVVWRFRGDYRSMESFYNTNDVPLLGYTAWSVTYEPTVEVTLIKNADQKASEKILQSIRALAQERATNTCEALHFVDKPPQTQKHIYLQSVSGTREKPELLLIARFGRALAKDEREEQRRADWIWHDFLESFKRYELHALIGDLKRGTSNQRLERTGVPPAAQP